MDQCFSRRIGERYDCVVFTFASKFIRTGGFHAQRNVKTKPISINFTYSCSIDDEDDTNDILDLKMLNWQENKEG